MVEKLLSKEKLIARLKALLKSETLESIRMGAMCYSLAPLQAQKVKCEFCGKIVEEYGWMSSRTGIEKEVEEIKKLGYDAKVENICAACATKLGISEAQFERQLYCVSYFKTKDDEHYYVSESSNENEYKAVLSFLKNEPTYTDYYDATHLVKEELDVIKRMTGISID